MKLTGPVLTRRDFVKLGGALFVSLALPEVLIPTDASAAEASDFRGAQISSWLEIRADGTIIARTGKAEVGTGMSAYYAQMVAEELRVRPETITLVMGDTDRTPDAGRSAEFTVGARNIGRCVRVPGTSRLGRDPTGRSCLRSVGERWRVHRRDGNEREESLLCRSPSRSAAGSDHSSYRRPGQRRREENRDRQQGRHPRDGQSSAEPASEFTVIGKSFPAPHVAEKVTAKTVWVGDFRLPGMLHARMVRPATLGSTLVSAGAIDKQRFPTADVMVRGNLVAVVSPDEWEAVRAARAVAQKTEWTAWAGLGAAAHCVT